MDKTLQALGGDVVSRYSARFKRMGVTPQTLGWGCKNDQLIRFSAMVANYDFSNQTVLDLGCGFADLYTFLLEHNIKCNYYGIDIVPDFITHCQNLYPNLSDHFVCCDFNELPVAFSGTCFDVIVTNGTLNYKIENNMEYTKFVINHAFSITNHSVIFDFLSTYVTPDYPKEEVVYYHSPIEILEYALELTNNVKLIHNYQPIPQKEFMIIMNKN